MQPEKFINSVLDVGFADSPKGTEEKESLRAELQKIREQGFVSHHKNEGVASVSVPIRIKVDNCGLFTRCNRGKKNINRNRRIWKKKRIMDSARGLEGARSQTE